jgi:hypothetical protein
LDEPINHISQTTAMRLLRNLIKSIPPAARSAPKRDFAHVHDVRIEWERAPNSNWDTKSWDNNDNDNGKEAGSMALNGMYYTSAVMLGLKGSLDSHA